MTNPPTLGFLGLGAMGGGSAACLARAGHTLIAYDPLNDRLRKVVDAGATAAADEAQVMRDADVVFISMPFPDILTKVVDEKVMPRVREGQTIVDLSTTPVEQTRTLAESMAAKGARWIDAPVSGGPDGAASGNLRVFVGGDKATFDRLRPVLDTIGQPEYVVYCGSSGAGQVVKGVNQLTMGLVTAACLESLSFGVRSGVDPQTLLAAIGGDSGCRGEFATAARRVIAGEGEYVHIKYGQFDEFLGHAHAESIPMPITDALRQFCAKGEPRVFELPRHKRTGRKAPSFWYELQNRDRAGRTQEES